MTLNKKHTLSRPTTGTGSHRSFTTSASPQTTSNQLRRRTWFARRLASAKCIPPSADPYTLEAVPGAVCHAGGALRGAQRLPQLCGTAGPRATCRGQSIHAKLLGLHGRRRGSGKPAPAGRAMTTYRGGAAPRCPEWSRKRKSRRTHRIRAAEGPSNPVEPAWPESFRLATGPQSTGSSPARCRRKKRSTLFQLSSAAEPLKPSLMGPTAPNFAKAPVCELR